MTLGVVYCAVSASYPGRCKIGKTFRNAPQRIAELQRHYKSRHAFIEHASLLAEHYGRVELLTHQRLAHCREPATEMFRCTPEEAMAVIRWAADEALRNPPRYQPKFQPRPVARHRTLAKGRGTYRRHNPWPLILATVAILVVAFLAFYKPMLPDAILRTADRVECWLN